MGLLKTPEREENLVSPQGTEALKDPSPFKDLMATLEKPADLTAHPGTPVGHFGQLANVTSPPHSAGYMPKKTPSFFQVSTKENPPSLLFFPLKDIVRGRQQVILYKVTNDALLCYILHC